MLSLCGMPVPGGLHGRDLSGAVTGEGTGRDEVLIMSPVLIDNDRDMPEWWGLRTPRYTYARRLDGPWVLYDNEADPYQFDNRADDPALADVRRDLDRRLHAQLREAGEEMVPWEERIRSLDLVDVWNEREQSLHGDRGRHMDRQTA